MTIHVTWEGVLALIGAGALVYFGIKFLYMLIIVILWGMGK